MAFRKDRGRLRTAGSSPPPEIGLLAEPDGSRPAFER